MAISAAPRSQKLVFLTAGAAFFLVFIVLWASLSGDTWQLLHSPVDHPTQTPPPSSIPTPLPPDASKAERPDVAEADRPDAPEVERSRLVEQYLKHIARPSIPVAGPEVTLFGAQKWKLNPENEAYWQEPHGEGICIMDLDNRIFNETGRIWSDTLMSWDKPDRVHGLSLGILNHWLYAKIHGYAYYYIDIDEFPDRRASWKKPSIMPELLKRHETCIFLDSDAVFNHLTIPFEWLMNYWGLDPTQDSLALAFDPDLPWNKDKFNKTYVNTGFIIAQNNQRTFEIMDAWKECADEGGRHPDCTKFRTAPPGQVTDQGGFGTYIRYDYKDNVKELKCDEANGFPQSGTKCHGTFISHLWTGKDSWIKRTVGQQIPGDLLEAFHEQFLKEKDTFWMTEKELMAHA